MKQFKDRQIGERFLADDKRACYIKKSSRTATADKGHPAEGKWFYFGHTESTYNARLI